LSAAAKVQGATLRPEARSSSDFVIERDVLQAAPHKDATAMLATAPGVYVARSEGDAVAAHVFLRGFDAEHGQDIAFSAGGIPINLPSHLHGQGYADLGFIPTEAVRYVRVTEGVYDPRQGDFAVAGSVDFELGVPERGLLSRTSYGSFGTLRQLLLWAPEGEPVESFASATYGSTDGFGDHRDGQHAGVMAQHVMESGRWKGRVLGSFYGARSRLAGVLRQDDIDRGAVDFYGVYSDPAAQNQSALASEGKLGFFAEHHGSEGSVSKLGAWLALHSFRSQQAFTGYTERSQINPEWTGRGDLIEQDNSVTTLGLSASHRTQRYELASWVSAALEGGLIGRIDRIEQAQNLLQAPQNETWDQRVDASIDGSDIGAYVDLELRMVERLTVHAGARGNALHYVVDDRLGNFIPSFRRDSYIVGFRRTAFGFAAGPRVSAELAITSWLSALAAYGQGYRSPQARLLEDGESAPFTKVHSGDAGVRVKLAPEDRVVVTASGFYTTLSDDVAFDPAEGRLEPIGPTTRKGATLHAVARPWSFLVASGSLTYVRAELDAPPPATAEDPAPPYRQGELLPYVPPLVVRIDLGARQVLTRIEGHSLDGRLGLGFSHLAPRPLPFQAESAALSLFDASASLRYRAVELGVEAFNLFDLEYAATEHVFASNWQPSEAPSRLPARHIAAGPPRTVLVTLGLHL
jgi:iron complex outermembrane receptor protein